MTCLAALDLSASQARTFKEVYADGQVATESLINLFHYMPRPPAFALMGIPVPLLDPAHFSFVGNRPYLMQVVGNGSVFGVLSQERPRRKDKSKLSINVARMEVIISANLPFLKANPPTERQLRQFHADFIEWSVEGFRAMRQAWPPKQREFLDEVARGYSPGKDPAVGMILAGGSPQDALASWVSQGQPGSPLVQAVALDRRPHP